MKIRVLPLFVVLALGFTSLNAGDAHAQSAGVSTPAPSLAASVSQTVGITDVSVKWSSPAAREREVWGGLVPWDTPWRFGANAPTRISFSTDVTIGGSTVAAGEYSIIAVPGQNGWTVGINTDPSGRGAFAYDAANNVAALQVQATEAPFRERMIIYFNNTTNEGTELTMEWAGLSVVIPVAVETAALVNASVDAVLAELWRPQFQAGRYYYENTNDLARAEELMAASMALTANWWNTWFLAMIKHDRGQNAQARELATQARTLGAGDSVYEGFFKEAVEAALANWPRR